MTTLTVFLIFFAAMLAFHGALHVLPMPPQPAVIWLAWDSPPGAFRNHDAAMLEAMHEVDALAPACQPISPTTHVEIVTNLGECLAFTAVHLAAEVVVGATIELDGKGIGAPARRATVTMVTQMERSPS